MTVKELKSILNYCNDDEEIIVFYEYGKEKNSIVEDVVSACKNGNCLQLNLESIYM